MKFSNILRAWYSDNKRELPWRATKNPYEIWLSEVILQQTQVQQGLPYYSRFIAEFPTINELAEASEEDVLRLWQGLGYYSRARNLHTTAKTIVKDHNGHFPDQYEGLIKLKGIGDYTASAIASICFNSRTAVVDGNVYRLLSRYFGIETPINSTKGVREFKALAQKLLPINGSGDHNQAIMEFGARQCKPKSPDCGSCPLNGSCLALKTKKIDLLPIKINKTKIRKRYFNYVVIISGDGKTILEKRTGKGIWQNLYQFPLIETKSELTIHEFSSHKAIIDLLKEMPFQFSLFNEKDVIHKLSHQILHTRFWIVNVDQLPLKGIDLFKIHQYPVPVLISNFIKRLNFNE
jgi:A/G-specific adenine glycosylase